MMMEEPSKKPTAIDASAIRRAGFWIRFSADFIDGIPLGIVWLAVTREIPGAIGFVISIAAVLAYYTCFEGSTGQTIGKRLCDIRVVDRSSGDSIGFGRAALRFVVSYVSTVVFFLGYLWMLWNSERQTWHDMASNSIVVLTSAPEPERTYKTSAS